MLKFPYALPTFFLLPISQLHFHPPFFHFLSVHCPACTTTMDLDRLLSAPIAHRGLHSGSPEVPENSLPAFSRAVEEGFPIELDVQSSSDGEAVVFHDWDLQRVCGRPELVRELPAAELLSLSLFGSAERMPLLSEVFSLVAGRVPLLIEVKNKGRVGGLESKVAELIADYDGPVTVQSFNPRVVKWFRLHTPHLLRGQLSRDFSAFQMPWWVKYLRRNLWYNHLSRPHYIGYEVGSLPNRRVTRLRRRGLPVLGWTVKDAAGLEKAATFCDNIFFESLPLDTIRKHHARTKT